MTDWTSGYVAELGYTHGFYKELTSELLAFSAKLSGYALAPVATFCELGCGQGFSTNLLAAANPYIQFYATDFNPAQIAGAQRLARAAKTPNVHFFDDSFQQFETRSDLPQFDIIALHGIYSWIAKEHRDTIVRFIDKRLKPGGLVYISYNCLPGWAGPSPIRQLLRLAADATAGGLVQKIEGGLSLIDRMHAAGAKYFANVPGIEKRIETLKSHNRNYLAHEYMNADWNLFYHSDVAAELSDARLSFLSSANLLDHVDAINLTAEQQSILGEVAAPVARQTLRDFMVNQQFRKDIFVRGGVSLSVAETREAILDSRFALVTPRAEVPTKIAGSLGEANLQPAVYEPILDAFAKPAAEGRSGAIALRQVIVDNPSVAALGWPQILQAITVLVGANQLHPCPSDPKGDSARSASTRRFNQAVMGRASYGDELQFLASPVTGGGIAVDRFQQLFLQAAVSKEKNPVEFVWRTLEQQGLRMMKDGKALEAAEDNIAELTTRYAAYERRLPTLRSLGIA